ncbi:MAG TPA: nucleotide disphospho-sugar-binding domain-containing protein [Polyangiaceae bacterium]
MRKRLLFVTENVTMAQVVRLLALARRLPSERYEVHFACAEGAPWLFSGTSFRRWPLFTVDGARALAALAKGERMYDTATLERYVTEELRLFDALQPDLVIADFRLSVAVSARLAGVRCASLINAYWSPFAQREQFPMPDHPLVRLVGVARAERYFPQALPRVFTHFAAPLNVVRRRHGMPATSLLEQLCFGDSVLYPDIPELCPLREAPSSHHFLGAVPWSPDLPLAPELLAGDSSQPLVYVTLGSSGDHGVLAAVLAGLEGLPIRGVLALAGKPAPARMPANFRVADYVPGDLLAQRARFVINNGGSGSAYQALAAGVPVLGIPSNLDQYLTMQVITRAGAGVMLRSGTLTAEQVRRSASQLCDDDATQQRARELAARFRAYDCHTRFARWLDDQCDAESTSVVG